MKNTKETTRIWEKELPGLKFEGKSFVNLTRAEITVKRGDETYVIPRSGEIVEISTNPRDDEEGALIKTVDLAAIEVPDPVPNFFFIVPAPVAFVIAPMCRDDIVVPDTQRAERNEKGRILSVPGFLQIKG